MSIHTACLWLWVSSTVVTQLITPCRFRILLSAWHRMTSVILFLPWPAAFLGGAENKTLSPLVKNHPAESMSCCCHHAQQKMKVSRKCHVWSSSNACLDIESNFLQKLARRWKRCCCNKEKVVIVIKNGSESRKNKYLILLLQYCMHAHDSHLRYTS